MKLRNVLVPTDFSGDADRPFHWGMDLGAKVILLHVIQDLRVVPTGAAFAPPMSAPGLDEEVEAAKEKIEKMAADLAVDAEGVVLTSEDVPRAIAEYANEHDIDLVALSTHGRSGFRRLVLGSVAENVLRHSKVPVLCFPRKED